jgi:hypothetical protein
MRSNQNPSGSVTRGVGARNVAGEDVAGNVVAKLSMPQMPVEWLDAGSWRLPSGKALAEFALQAGFLAPLLFRAERLGKSALIASPGSSEAPGMSGNVARGKPFGKGDGR